MFYNVNKDDGSLIPVAGATLYADTPVGSIMPFGGTAMPDGWLSCSGQEISRTDYADLFAVIGTYYGSGNGTTTFNVPDLREATPKGTGLSGKSNVHYSVGGITLGHFVDDQIQDHTHQAYKNFEGGATGGAGGQTTLGGLVETTGVYTGRKGSTTEVKAVGVNFIIKAKKVGVPADFMNAVDEAIDTSNLAKVLPYSFNASSNISAFNRKFVKQGSSITWTATHTGRLTLRFLKAGDGYSLYLNKNGALADSYDNFFGTDSQSAGCTQASITLQAWVRKGDTINLESNLPSSTASEQTFFCQTGLLAYNNSYD